MTLSHKNARIRHERMQHKLEITRGQSLSPVPGRHQSCPKPSSESVPVISPPASRSSSIRRKLFPDTSPPIPMSLPTSSTSKLLVDSSESFQSQDDNDVPKTFCLSCNQQFTSLATYNKHLPCRFEVNEEKLTKNPRALKLCPPLDRENIPKILQHLAESDFVDLCISQKWCCKDVWPLVFLGPERSAAGILGQYTANKRSFSILKRYLMVRNVITIPRCILIEDSKLGIKSLLTGQLLLPPRDSFHSVTTPDSYIVTKFLPGRRYQVGGDGGGDDGGDGGSDGGSVDDSSDGSSNHSDDDEDPDMSEDSDDNDAITVSLQAQQQPFAAQGTFQDIRHLLPNAGPGAFDPGVDGEGKRIYRK